MKTLFAATLTGAALLSGAALAADLPAPAPMPYKAPAAVAPVYNWTGCYVAGGFGYGVWNQDNWPETFPGLVLVGGSSRVTNGGRGWMGLAGGGCDVEVPVGFFGNVVFGAFADYDFMDIHGAATLFAGIGGEQKQRDAWAAGARVGVAVTPNLLAYSNGGFTQSHFNGVTLQISPGAGALVGSTPAHTFNGWFLGGGTEYALNFSWLPIHGLFWRNEYRFSSFGKADLPITPAPGSAFPAGFGSHQQYYEQQVLSELVWRFNWQ